MEPFLLPSTTYESPSRQVRGLKLNTIMEDESMETRGRGSGGEESPSSAYSPKSASTISSYYHGSHNSKVFDDLYDVSESESDRESGGPTIRIKRASTGSNVSSNRDSWTSTRSKNRYPSLVIPSPRHWPTIDNFKKNSPVPPTPPSKIPISPEVLSKLPMAHMSSAPPSLDGSLTSDQHANSTAPPTPDVLSNPSAEAVWGHVEIARPNAEFAEESGPTIEMAFDPGDSHDTGVQLPAEALNILQHLSFDESLEAEAPSTVEKEESREMEEIGVILRRPPSAEVEPASATSEYSISQLSIPSPGGFFSSLDSESRNTWRASSADLELPPSSTTAEHFYNAPWNSGTPQIVERTIDVDDADTEGPPTAVRIPFSPDGRQEARAEQVANKADLDHGAEDGRKSSVSTLEEIDTELRAAVESALDRTSLWAAAQSSYLAALSDTNPINRLTDGSIKSALSAGLASVDSSIRKVVKFLDTEAANAPFKDAPALTRSDSVFYKAFQRMSNLSSPTDSFIHRHTRFDAIQALRSSLRSHHIDNLLGNYQTIDANRPAPQRPISMMPSKIPSEDDEEAEAKRIITQLERERQALEQVAPAMWIVEAMRFLANGRLLNSPAASLLAKAPPLASITPPDHVRVLDLGGQAQCDWAWHCAREYANVKTYTATCDDRPINHYLRGPSNHRLVKVDNLYCLPFPGNHFDVISARSLPMFLRAGDTNSGTDGNGRDEYDRCLKECVRCLKPGGYLEFFLLDSEIVLAGPRGTAASVEFGFNLRSRGYDPAPTKSWLSRVRRAGLVDIKRAWMFLPIGAIRPEEERVPETPPPRLSTYENQLGAVEAVQGPVGSKADAAHVSGLVGSCLWERWLLKLQMEMGKETGLLDGVGAVVEEGRSTGAGWRCMSGWAKKDF